MTYSGIVNLLYTSQCLTAKQYLWIDVHTLRHISFISSASKYLFLAFYVAYKDTLHCKRYSLLFFTVLVKLLLKLTAFIGKGYF